MVGWADLATSWADVEFAWRFLASGLDDGVALGGNEVFEVKTPDGLARVHLFTSGGTFEVLQDGGLNVEYLVVAGGGSGGTGPTGTGRGGGGAGGMRTGTLSVAEGSVTVTVGAGGAAVVSDGSVNGNPGQASTFGTVATVGGGAGAGSSAGGNGGSGGGGRSTAPLTAGTGTAGEGNAGGIGFIDTVALVAAGGGGGGAGAAGQAGSLSGGGAGGAGASSSITGVPVMYAGGGGGSSNAANPVGAGGAGGGGAAAKVTGGAGVNGSGGGGGAASGGTGVVLKTSGAGGSGVVAIRYLIPVPPYKPEPAILIGDQNFTGNTIGQVTIRRGRDSVYVEPSASYAAVNLVSVGQSLPLQVGQELFVTLNDAYNDRDILFRGRISDIEVSVTPAQTLVGGYRITAVGPLAGANRRQVLDTGRAVEKDGERAEAAIVAAFGTAILAPGLFDDGVYDLAALDPEDGGYSALSIAQEAAASGGGVLYETRDGLIAYADADRRAATLADDAFETISGNILDPSGMNASSSLSELSNTILLDWNGGVVERSVQESIDEFGLFVRRVSTILNEEVDAETRAGDLAQNLAAPAFKADVFRLLLNNAAPPLVDLLVRVEPNDGISFRNLPQVIGFTRLDSFVEGVEWRIDPFTVELALFASDERLSVGLVYWGRVTDTLEWRDVDGSLAWRDVGRTL
jgi:hypothetical protein